MINAPIAGWLDLLWEAVCLRAARPIPGILLDEKSILEVAQRTFEDFLESGGRPEASLQSMLTVLTQPVQQRALAFVAQTREADADHFRDAARKTWEHNPALPALFDRSNEGRLVSPEWRNAEPVLWQRAAPIYRRMRISEDDARDVYAETVADFLKARAPEDCPMRKMLVFEELPRLFGVVAERRAISWVRKQTTLKMQPNRNGLSLNDPDLGLGERLMEPRSLSEDDPLAHTHYDRIREVCGEALDDFEWHLMETLFVEGNRTRDQLVQEDWTLEQLELKPDASRSTKLRRLNTAIANALASLGRELEEADL